MAPDRGKERDAREPICLCKDVMREDAMELGDPFASARDTTQRESKIAERDTAYNAAEMSKVARIDERDEEHRKWKAYHRNVRKYSESVSKAASSKDDNPS